MNLYGYFRSSAAYRVRIALNLKNVDYQHASVHLRNKDQRSPDFLELNPQGLVPVLEADGQLLTQSLAIMEYLDVRYPAPALLPADEIDRAYVRSIALQIACDLHPLNNLRVLQYLEYNLGLDRQSRDGWYRHWITVELQALENKLISEAKSGLFCYGDAPTLADICLVPQLANARRLDCELSSYPAIVRIEENCNKLAAFKDAAPANQPDAE